MQEQSIQETNRFARFGIFLSLLVTFILPIEHKYDKFLRFYSLKIIPKGLALPPGFDKNIYLYASDVIALLLFAILLSKISIKDLVFKKGAIFLWGIFLSALVSLFISPFSNYITAYTRLIQLLTPILLYTFLTNQESIKLKDFFYILVFAATIQSCIAITQYFSQQHLGLRLLSECRDPPAGFYMPDAKRWIFDSLFGTSAPSNIIKRSAGTLPHCNILGGFFVASIMATYSLFATSKKKHLLSVILFLQFFALNLTYSRSAIFGLILGTIVWFAWSFIKGERYRYLAFAICLSGLLCISLLLKQSLHRGGLLNYNQTAKLADTERLDAQVTAIEMIKDKPLTGVGFGQFGRESYARLNSNAITHNIYLYILSEMGLVAILSFLGFIAFVLTSSLKAPFSPEIASLTSAFIAFIFIGGCDFYLITSQQGKLVFFLTAGLLVMESFKRRADAKLQNV